MKCALAYLGGCNGRMTAHHCVPRQRLKREFPVGANVNILTGRKYVPVNRRDVSVTGRDVPLTTILKDPRNLLDLCFHHHMAWEKRALRLHRDNLPESVEEFARDYGMTWSLDRDYGERSVPTVADYGVEVA